VLFALGLVMQVNGQVFEKSSTRQESFPAGKETTVSLSNKYGNIQIIPSSTDSVKFLVEIKVINKKEADADKKLDAIDIKFSGNLFMISATTIFKDAPTQIQTEIEDFTKTLFNPTNRVEINYFVYLPSYVHLKIDNKYGNIFISDHAGNCDITLSNGDLKAGNLNGDITLNFNFVKAFINTTLNLKADLNYTELNMKNCGSIRLNSRSSKFWLNKAEKMEVESKNDKFYIDTVATVNGKTNFSYLQISHLSEGILLRSVYGDLNLNDIGPKVKYINLNTEYTDMTLLFPKESAFTLFVDYRKTKLTFAPDIGKLDSTTINADQQQYNLNGTIGNGAGPGAPVQIFSVSGSLIMLNK
jgi:hypothetical protein